MLASPAFDDPSVLSRPKLFEAADGVLEPVLVGDCGVSFNGEMGTGDVVASLSFPVTASEIARSPSARRTLGVTLLIWEDGNGEDRPELSPSGREVSGEKAEKNPGVEWVVCSRLVTVGECDWLLGLSGERALELRKRDFMELLLYAFDAAEA